MQNNMIIPDHIDPPIPEYAHPPVPEQPDPPLGKTFWSELTHLFRFKVTKYKNARVIWPTVAL